MKFGVLASHQYRPEDDLRQRLAELWDLTELAASLGYDSIFGINHFLGNLQTPQSISVLATLVQHAGEMTVGTCVLILPAFHPVHVAEELATLDHLSNGRIVLGVGAGYRRNEFAAFGIDKQRRFRQMRESIELIRALWTGKKVTFKGEFYTLEDQEICVKPLQRGGPPIWIGAGGMIAIRKAAEVGDAWISPGNAPTEGWLEKAMATHEEALAAAGKRREEREYPIVVNIFCASTTEKARELVRPYVESEYFAYAEYPQLAFQRERFEFMWENRFLIGDPDHVSAKIEELRRLGINHLIGRPFWTGTPHDLSVESMRLVAREVMPRFRAAPALGSARGKRVDEAV